MYCTLCNNLYICVMARPKKIRELTDEIMGVNPLMNDIKIPVRRKKKEDAETLGGKWDILECTHFLKLYEDTKYRENMMALSPRAKEMYLYILHFLPRGKDYMGIDRVKYMDKNSIKSPHTFINAIKELDDKGYISLKPFMKDIFFINPKLFFNGSRVNKFPDNLTVQPWKNKKGDDDNG